ncbi:MAG: transcription-repair coupling factor [Acidobacteria bacterium]|nr:MAG: transcription-repair coupling factor [Acidobacteriota bacterium]
MRHRASPTLVRSDAVPNRWSQVRRALRASPPYRALVERLGEVRGLPPPAAAWVLGLVAEDLGRPLLVVVPHESEAYAWLEAARLIGDGPPEDEGLVYLPAPSLSPYQEAEVSLSVRAEEAVAVDRLVRGVARAVVTTPRALFRRLPVAADFAPAVLTIAAGEEHPQEELAAHLQRWGYRRADLVTEVGDFAVRGGVFDLFPPGSEMPLRLDFFGDTVDSIRYFEPASQRSNEERPAARVLPLSLFPAGPDDAVHLAEKLAEMELDERMMEDAGERIHALRTRGGFDGWEHLLPAVAERTATACELLAAAGEAPLVAAFDPESVTAEIRRHAELLEAELESRRSRRRMALPPQQLEHEPAAVLALVEGAELRAGGLLSEPRRCDGAAIDFGATLTETLHDQLPRLAREVDVARSRGERVLLVAEASHHPRLRELLESLGLDGADVELVAGELARGFRLPAAGVVVFGERQLLRRSPLVRRPAGRRFGPFLSSLRDLKVGDYVVHADHGIGQFMGLTNLAESTVDGAGALPPALADARREAAGDTEVMEIVYAGGRRLLLPLSRLDLIQKFSGIEGVAPRLDRLGGTSWQRTKRRIKKGMRDMAQELLKLYAERQLATAPKMLPDSDLQAQFEAAFAFDETPDQLAAAAEIKRDLEQTRPMDRLLCGDVGFGKTEVAMRAAFKVVDSGYQVVVLAPTTILADQHLETFRRRFADFPVVIDMVSRFRSNAEVRAIQKKAAAGKIDVLIGTHRLLNKAFTFPKLGLLIVDEEQRFGVAQKERLKQLKKDVHALAMSATPVPRTLQLSLAGVRDLSLIETPPRDRMAVETAIVPFDPQLIREAVELEIERGGQVYYVYNQVETIERMASYLREILPGIKLTVGHGQMDEAELARRMHAFVAGEHQLLLATTIIENGIDIPNVNTMIVHHAERFGLSQLYQLRGRVGRSDQLAYCYLLVAADRILTEQARKRLAAIREFTELGAGFRVAGRDLEIRGAGNLLGAEQSGHIAAVGIETYLKMLEETIAELKGEAPEEAPSVTLDLPLPTSIPESYVGDANLRMELYQRIATGDASEEAMLDELRDRFGPPPDGVRTFIRVAMLKRLAESLRLQAITARAGRLTLRLRQDARIDPERLIAFVQQRPGSHFSPSGALTLERVPPEDLIDVARRTLEELAA